MTNETFDALAAVIRDRKQNPAEGSYTCYLFDKGLDKILKKVGEEASPPRTATTASCAMRSATCCSICSSSAKTRACRWRTSMPS